MINEQMTEPMASFTVGDVVRVKGGAYDGLISEVRQVFPLTIELEADGCQPLFYFEEVEMVKAIEKKTAAMQLDGINQMLLVSLD